MIALDTNVLVRYLVDDDTEQALTARSLLDRVTAERPAFICRDVMVELVWVLQRTLSAIPQQDCGCAGRDDSHRGA